jgi:hypothetical protein
MVRSNFPINRFYFSVRLFGDTYFMELMMCCAVCVKIK